MKLWSKFAFWFSWWFIIAATGILFPAEGINVYVKAIFTALGVFMIIYGLTLNAIAGRTLKKYGHMEIKHKFRKPDKLVKVGIYSCMRHPAQFGSILFGLGIALLTASIYAILLAGWYAFFAVYFILAIEERETLNEFGDAYADFIRTRKPFSFSLRCLKIGIIALRDK